MRKLILTSYTANLEGERFTENRLVVVNHDEGETENDLTERAVSHVHNWLKVERPHLDLISIIAYPTIGDDPDAVVLPVTRKRGEFLESPFAHAGWHTMEEIPTHGTEAESEQVIIDLNGKRQIYGTGYYDKTDSAWVIENYKEYYEPAHARYANLPIDNKE